MGVFFGLKSIVRKSEAAVVIQKLLEQQVTIGFVEVDPHALANKLVQTGLGEKSTALRSGNAKLPDKFALAAAALSRGVKALDGADRDAQLALLTSLGSVLTQISANGGQKCLNPVDVYLVEAASSVYSHFAT